MQHLKGRRIWCEHSEMFTFVFKVKFCFFLRGYKIYKPQDTMTPHGKPVYFHKVKICNYLSLRQIWVLSLRNPCHKGKLMQALNFGWCWALSVSSAKVHEHSHYFKHVSNYTPQLRLRLKWLWEQHPVQDFHLVSCFEWKLLSWKFPGIIGVLGWRTYHAVDNTMSDQGSQKNPSVTWAEKFISFLQ